MTYRQEKLKVFAKSLAWNAGMMTLAFVLDALAKNLGIFDLSPEMTAFLGVILARISKVVNVYYQAHKELE